MRKIAFAAAILLLALAACGQAGPSVSQPTASAPTAAPSATTAPQPTDAPAATSAPQPTATPGRPTAAPGASVRPPDTLVAAAQQRLAQHLGIPADSLMLQSANHQEWPDGALGCPEPGKVYPQVVTPGFLLIFSNGAQTQTYTVHTAESEQQMILCENDKPTNLASQPSGPALVGATAQPGPASNDQAELARQALAKELGIDAAEIKVTQIEQIEWRDSSLGCPKPGMNYLQVITPGYRIVLEAQGSSYEYHTDTGTRVVRCDTPAAGTTPGTPNLDNPLAGTSWRLEAIGAAGNPQPVVASSEVTMIFAGAEPSVGGNSGCNSYSGKYAVDGAKITFSEIASTQMACDPPQRMELEAQFLQALLAVERYEITGDRLELTYGGSNVLRLRAMPHTF